MEVYDITVCQCYPKARHILFQSYRHSTGEPLLFEHMIGCHNNNTFTINGRTRSEEFKFLKNLEYKNVVAIFYRSLSQEFLFVGYQVKGHIPKHNRINVANDFVAGILTDPYYSASQLKTIS